MLSYVAQALWNADPKEEQFYRSFENNIPGVYHKSRLFEEFEHDLRDADIRIALWRDPIEKFVSGFYHTMSNPANKNLWIKSPSLTNFLNDIEVYKKNPNVADHCETNTARLGTDKSIYTHIYNYKHVHKIAELLGVPAADTHHRKDNTMRTGPTDLQKLRIKQVMLEDYVNGWC
tara:strand:- start:443 stop:967 length:525 start_codon:yes stop_codon:yes gene_type:complete